MRFPVPLLPSMILVVSAVASALAAPAPAGADLLPAGRAPPAPEAAWFPSRLHAFVWRNWSLVAPERLARTIGARTEDIVRVGRSLGLEPARGLSADQWKRAHLTILRRNWHLLPYEQLLTLLDWSAERLAYTLREDDFFFHKVGDLKPRCAPLRWAEPTTAEASRAAEIATLVRETFPAGNLEGREPLFAFVGHLQSPPPPSSARTQASSSPSAPLRLGYSYFALCGDPLVDPSLDPYPDGLLARLAAAGANAVWLHVELGHLAPLPWLRDDHIETRRAALRRLVARAAAHGMKIFLYLNEPRALPARSPVFADHPDWRGVEEKGFSALCTSTPAVRTALRDAIAGLCQAVPDLGGFFTITASENLTNCWSHHRGTGCPRCKERRPAEVIAEMCATVAEGVRAGKGRQRYLCWDWGWRDDWALDVIARLPSDVALMSVSEWSLPIERGGVKSTIGEYSISSIGPGPRALRHWEAARKRGLEVVAKIQCGNTWELSAVPYLPVLENITRHAEGLRAAGVRDIMLGWTLGGYPSPNVAAIAEIFSGGSLETLAQKRHGESQAPAAADFWRACSAAFREFPYHSSAVYRAPLQMGPANPLWAKPTGYQSCMVGIPYDDLTGWRSVYPSEIFATQLEKVVTGFEAALARLRSAVPQPSPALAEEIRFAEAAAIHFASVAHQCRAVLARDAGDAARWRALGAAEEALAVRLHALQSRDSRIGFEASNQYYYVPLDLVEKVINCRWAAGQEPTRRSTPGTQRSGRSASGGG
ncbi:MAG: hypothetical protein HZC55_06540 [Verrucomicrobia bacterium]|nr:hypothetical protein [Verrucomicrobiota bacterium]